MPHAEIYFITCDLVTGEVLEELRDVAPGGPVNRILAEVAPSTAFSLPLAEQDSVGAPPPGWEGATEPGRTMLVMVMDGQPRWAGIILEREGGTEGAASLVCSPLEAYLDRRFVQDHRWVQQDEVGVIAVGLIADAQVEGIGLVVDAPATGTLRDRFYVRTDDRSVKRALDELVQLDDGIEWTIDLRWQDEEHRAVEKVIRVRKRIGQPAPETGPTAVFSTVGAGDARYSYREGYGAGEGADHVIARAQGQGDLRPESAPARDEDLLAAGWPRWEELVNVDSSTGIEEVTNATILQASAVGHLNEVRRGSRTFRLTSVLDAVPRLGQQWELGDDIGFDVIGPRHPDGVTGVARVIGWSVDTVRRIVEPLLVLDYTQFAVGPTPPSEPPPPPPEPPAVRCQVDLRTSIKSANSVAANVTSLAVDRPDDTEVGDRHYVFLSSHGGAVTHSAPDGTWRQVGSTIVQSNTAALSVWVQDATVAGSGSHGSFGVGASGRRVCLTALAVFNHDPDADDDGALTVLGTAATITFPAATPTVEKDLLIYAGNAGTAAGGTGSVSGWETNVTERVDQVTTHATNANCNQAVATFPVTGTGTVPAEVVTLAQGSFAHVGVSLLVRSGVSPCDAPPVTGGGELVSSIYVPSEGAWHGNSPGARSLTAFEADIGQQVDIVHRFKNFGSYDTAGENFPGATEQAWIDQGRMLLWSWKTQGFTWAQVAAGSADAVIDATAANVVEWENSATGGDWAAADGKKIKTFFSYHHEPEGDDTFGTSADYVAAYQYVHDRFIQQGVRSFIFVWIVAGFKDRVSEFHAKYPGDAYVDWIGYDPYPRVCANPIGPNDPFFESIGEDQGGDVDDTGKYRVYKWATGPGSRDPQDGLDYVKPGAHNMPIMVCEWSPVDSITNPTGAMVPIFEDWKEAIETGRYPQIRAWVYWESGENPGNDCTHRINITAATTAAYKAVTDLPQLNRPLPY